MKKKILVIDNNRIILNWMKKLLEKEGHDVATAEDGLLAITILDEFQPDIIFTDLIMPNIEGDKLCEIVRSKGLHDNCYLVLMSAAAVEINFEEVDISAEAFIAKGPFNEMSRNILDIINQSDPGQPGNGPKPVVGVDSVYPRQMTRELLSRNDHLKTVIDSISEGMLEVTAGKIVYANQTACALFGLRPEQLLSVAPETLFEGEAADRVRSLMAAAVATTTEIGSQQPLWLAGKRVLIKRLPVIGEHTTILMITDVTEHFAIEQELRNYREHLEHLVEERTAELTRTTAKLQQAQKLEAMGTLAGGVAHDLNNVLSGIISYPELLLVQIGTDNALANPLRTIKKSGEKAAAIVQDLLTLARRGVAVANVVALNETILGYLDSPEYKKMQTYHPDVNVKTKLAADLPNILGSHVHLSKALMNLVSNAAEAMPSGGEIVITTRVRPLNSPVDGYADIVPGRYVELTVADTGMGISANDIARIFEPFYTKKKMGRSGTGLGMAVVWGTVKDHQGYIDVKSIPGKGTTFWLYFPVTERVREASPPKVSLELLRGQGETILVVDDMPEQLEIAAGMLAELGYEVVRADSGEAAVAYLERHTVDLLLLDMIMTPGIDGLETYRRILANHPQQKAVIFSGFSATDRVHKAQALGAGHFIRKPFSMQDLGLAVQKTLRGENKQPDHKH
jgi:PAS domain S-box-containing protein